MDDIDNRVIRSTITEQEAGFRLDVWLSRRFDYHSRNQWQQLIRSGSILVNEKPTRASVRLRTNDTVTFVIDNPVEPDVDLDYTVIHEEEDFMIINKPGNLPCHPSGRFYRHTLWFELSKKLGKIHIINRLDRETSGLVIVAKKADTASQLVEGMSKGEFIKKYLVIVYGRFSQLLNANGFLIPDTGSKINKKRRFVNSESEIPDTADAETAGTILRPVEMGDSWSLLEAQLLTGRFHQIRATCFSLGFPLYGDKIYGPDEQLYLRFVNHALTENDREALLMPRQALHAYHLSFCHPQTRQQMTFEIPLPGDMLCLQQMLKNSEKKSSINGNKCRP